MYPKVQVLCKVVPMPSPQGPMTSNGPAAREPKPRKIAPTVCRLGAPRNIQGECNTFDKLWVVRVDYTEHQVSESWSFNTVCRGNEDAIKLG